MGTNGSCSDAQIFGDCDLNMAISHRSVGFPDDDPLPRDDRDV